MIKEQPITVEVFQLLLLPSLRNRLFININLAVSS